MNERAAWDRLLAEPSRAHESFRAFRDRGPLRRVADFDVDGVATRTVRRWAERWNWTARAAARDDHLRMIEDSERIEAVRAMQCIHQRAGRAALQIAVEGMRSLRPKQLSANDVVRLLDLGARLERTTLGESVDDQLARSPTHLDDPWDRIARQLTDADPT